MCFLCFISVYVTISSDIKPRLLKRRRFKNLEGGWCLQFKNFERLSAQLSPLHSFTIILRAVFSGLKVSGLSNNHWISSYRLFYMGVNCHILCRHQYLSLAIVYLRSCHTTQILVGRFEQHRQRDNSCQL